MAVCCSGRCVVKLLVAFFIVFTCEAATPNLFYVCSNTTTYTPDSTFIVNLKSLLSTLSSNNIRNYTFYNATEGNSSYEPAYGLFMCRGDVTIDDCRDCVVTASAEILYMCPEEKKAYVWYNECFLRYDNQTFFGRMESERRVYFINTGNESESLRLSEKLAETMNSLATRASSDENRGQMKGFATGELTFSTSRTLYNLVQCTPDLSGSDCQRCLSIAINLLLGCCTGGPGARVMLPSCNIRYEFYSFYRVTAVPPLPSTSSGGKGGMSAQVIIGIVVGVVASILMLILGFCFLARRTNKYDSLTDGNEILIPESLQYNLSTIGVATNNFSPENKVGEGGFGDVFKGTLSNGQEVAVKKLSKKSGQGAQEFKNEVVLVAKLQHRNLVRLVGFCLEQEEKLLIYEFVPNKSLDYFLFDSEKQKLLNWSTRYKIIGGIAQGILYLHEHSRLKIIHRDLKASNILLDGDMNPKISDFGMARLVGIDQSQANTNRIVGTFGYMAPEYAMHGEFSIKSDVFSFGVLLLEIITGKKNNRFYQLGSSEDLLSHAWKRWKDGTPLDLVDPTLGDTIIGNEVIRCIHIGLLCVQEDPEERPTMTSVLLMLNSYSFPLPLPHQPAFFARSRADDMLMQVEMNSEAMQWSKNEVSLSELHPR